MMINKRTFIKTSFLSLVSTISFCFLNSVARDNVAVSAFLFLIFILFFFYSPYKGDFYIVLTSCILSFLLLLGKISVFIYESSGIALAFKIVCTPIGFYFLISRLLSIIFCYFDRLKVRKGTKKISNRIFIVSFIVIFVCWIPCWLADYPGIYTPDTISQIGQALGIKQYNALNPLAHTLLIKACYSIFSVFLDNNNAIFASTGIVQMLVNSFIYSLVVKYVYKKTGSIFFSVLSICFYALISYNAAYNISISKDAMYASSLALLVILICDYREDQSALMDVLLAGSFVMYSLMRANGFYSFLFVILFSLAFGLFKYKKRLTIIMLSSFVICVAIRYPVYSSFLRSANAKWNVEEASVQETVKRYFTGSFLYVMPFQQVANVVYHQRDLNEKETWLIEEYAPLDEIREVYNPILVDPLFEKLLYTTKETRLDIGTIEYIKLYIELLIKYPMDYLEAYVNMTKYYFYPNRYVKTYYAGIVENSVNISGEEIVDADLEDTINTFYDNEAKLPIVGSLYCPGVTTFILITVLAYALRKKNLISSVCLMLPFSNFIILMACVPLNDEFRYIYPLVALLPFICAQFFTDEVRNSEVQ